MQNFPIGEQPLVDVPYWIDEDGFSYSIMYVDTRFIDLPGNWLEVNRVLPFEITDLKGRCEDHSAVFSISAIIGRELTNTEARGLLEAIAAASVPT